jgi:hypothetical protein
MERLVPTNSLCHHLGYFCTPPHTFTQQHSHNNIHTTTFTQHHFTQQHSHNIISHNNIHTTTFTQHHSHNNCGTITEHQIRNTHTPTHVHPRAPTHPHTRACKHTNARTHGRTNARTHERTNSGYIRCIKPNHTKSAGVIDEELFRHQVKYLGLLENVRVRRAGFCFRETYKHFLWRCVSFRITWNVMECRDESFALFFSLFPRVRPPPPPSLNNAEDLRCCAKHGAGVLSPTTSEPGTGFSGKARRSQSGQAPTRKARSK